MQRDILLLTEMIDAAEQAQRLATTVTVSQLETDRQRRDRGSNFTAGFDAVLAEAGIQTVLCNIQTPRMNARSADADASFWTAPSSGIRPICGGSCTTTRPTTISTGHTTPCTVRH